MPWCTILDQFCGNFCEKNIRLPEQAAGGQADVDNPFDQLITVPLLPAATDDLFETYSKQNFSLETGLFKRRIKLFIVLFFFVFRSLEKISQNVAKFEQFKGSILSKDKKSKLLGFATTLRSKTDKSEKNPLN